MQQAQLGCTTKHFGSLEHHMHVLQFSPEFFVERAPPRAVRLCPRWYIEYWSLHLKQLSTRLSRFLINPSAVKFHNNSVDLAHLASAPQGKKKKSRNKLQPQNEMLRDACFRSTLTRFQSAVLMSAGLFFLMWCNTLDRSCCPLCLLPNRSHIPDQEDVLQTHQKNTLRQFERKYEQRLCSFFLHPGRWLFWKGFDESYHSDSQHEGAGQTFGTLRHHAPAITVGYFRSLCHTDRQSVCPLSSARTS